MKLKKTRVWTFPFKIGELVFEHVVLYIYIYIYIYMCVCEAMLCYNYTYDLCYITWQTVC
jgi:hypothetical protein